MKYKEQEIGVPTLEMVKEYINKKKFVISPRKVYQKYVDNGWTTTKHQPILTLEAAINGCNSYPEKYSDIDGPECYKELLTDARWIEFSRKVKLFYGNQCQGCGAKTKNLQAHHKVCSQGDRPPVSRDSQPDSTPVYLPINVLTGGQTPCEVLSEFLVLTGGRIPCEPSVFFALTILL